MPIPVCYFAEDIDGNYEVIDGLQRLTTIRRYLSDEFPLTGISVLQELAGRTFSELAGRDQRRLENRTIRCIVVTEESHPDIKFDVFERLNTGAASLTAQELRNCLYRGDFNDSLKKMAERESFVQLMGNFGNLRMAHEELILRFLALTDNISAYRPPLRQFLNQYMRKNRQAPPDGSAVTLFDESCKAVHEALGDGAFRVRGRDGRVHSQVNKALFDSIMVPVAFGDRREFVTKAEDVRGLRDRLLADETFRASIGRATTDRARMMQRIGHFADGLVELGITVNLPNIDG